MLEIPYKIIFRIEIDTLFDAHGKLSLSKMEHLAMVCNNMQNAGFQVLVVSSGAIMLGTAKMGLYAPPTELIAKQAIAAIGQADLIRHYQMFFDGFDQIVAQVLITRDVVNNPVRNNNARMTLNRLLQKGIIPIINENDSVSTDDIILDDNYPLTLIVARLVKPHAIVIKSHADNQYRLVVRNNPRIMDVKEEQLFDLANLLKSGKGIADKINFDCKSQKPVFAANESYSNGYSSVEGIDMINGFPTVLTKSN
jgi:glutamate 5-kinase